MTETKQLKIEMKLTAKVAESQIDNIINYFISTFNNKETIIEIKQKELNIEVNAKR